MKSLFCSSIFYSLCASLSASLFVGALATAYAQEKTEQVAARPAQQQVPATATEQYCTNIADEAADARISRQTQMLTDLRTQIEERIADLQAERAEYERWLQRREEFLQKAEDGVVAIYAQMRPDAAAPQLAAFEDETAASVLAKLNARTASAILSEMDPQRAAQLTKAIAGPPTDSEGIDSK